LRRTNPLFHDAIEKSHTYKSYRMRVGLCCGLYDSTMPGLRKKEQDSR
jgi:hypothetical protein